MPHLAKWKQSGVRKRGFLVGDKNAYARRLGENASELGESWGIKDN
jgi:hypothetical protein